jgi:hypothetical protein
MTKRSKPRKRYHPRIDANPLDLALSNVARLTPEQQTSLMEPARQSLAAFANGQGGAVTWGCLADCMNVGEALAELGIASNHLDLFLDAQRALCTINDRCRQTGQWTAEAEIELLDEAVWMAGVQLGFANQGELSQAIGLVCRRITAAKCGSAGPRVTVVGLIGA